MIALEGDFRFSVVVDAKSGVAKVLQSGPPLLQKNSWIGKFFGPAKDIASSTLETLVSAFGDTIKSLQLEYGYRRIVKLQNAETASDWSEAYVCIDILVRGTHSTIPVRWQHSGLKPLGKVKTDFLLAVSDEIEAAILGSPLPAPIQCPIIALPFVASQLIHECIGHTSEADNYLRYALPNGKKLGHRWTHFPLNVYDDPTLVGQKGSYSHDDDGVKARCANLLLAGEWSDLLANLALGSLTGTAGGHARRMPGGMRTMPRMTNTWAGPGETSVDEMISSISYGVLCGGAWGGYSNGLQFLVRPGWGRIIELGNLTQKYIRRFDICGNKFDTIYTIQGASPDVKWFSPFNGCDKDGQNNLPVALGSPAIYFDSVKLTPVQSF